MLPTLASSSSLNNESLNDSSLMLMVAGRRPARTATIYAYDGRGDATMPNSLVDQDERLRRPAELSLDMAEVPRRSPSYRTRPYKAGRAPGCPTAPTTSGRLTRNIWTTPGAVASLGGLLVEHGDRALLIDTGFGPLSAAGRPGDTERLHIRRRAPERPGGTRPKPGTDRSGRLQPPAPRPPRLGRTPGPRHRCARPSRTPTTWWQNRNGPGTRSRRPTARPTRPSPRSRPTSAR